MVFSVGIGILVATSFLKNRELLEFIHEHLAVVFIGLVVVIFVIMKLKKK